MRLGQLARKYGVSKKEIIAYLKEQDPSLHSLGHNTKLDEQAVASVAREFENVDDFQQEQQEPNIAEAPVGRQESEPEPDPAATSGNEDNTAPETTEEPKSEGVTIETDKLLELLESEDEPVDLSKITLIKAPKKELDGLKVVGRIELPEPKPRTPRKSGPPGSGPNTSKNRREHHQQLSEEESEKRRLMAKKRKEEYEARQEKRRKEKEKRQKKALNKARYQQKLEQAKASQLKHKPVPPKQETASRAELVPAPPKTWLGKLWKWWTTY
jgi:hypothetical protein